MPKVAKKTKQAEVIPDNLTIYNKKPVYDKLILPKLLEINAICMEHGIPYFSAFIVANNEKKTTYKYSGVSPSYMDVVLKTDNYAKHVCVSRGFDIKIPGVNDDDDNIVNSIQTFDSSDDIDL